jgi:hypothetical protein
MMTSGGQGCFAVEADYGIITQGVVPSGRCVVWPFTRLKKRESPVAQFRDDVLGLMAWSEENEGWEGEFYGTRYLIAHDGGSVPSPDLLLYARTMLGPPAPLETKVQRAKRIVTAQHPALAGEIAHLEVGTVSFSMRKRTRRIFGVLQGGKSDRCWRVEFTEDFCDGIGFDT